MSKFRPRIHYTEAHKALMWDRWQQGGQLVELTVTHPEADAGDLGLGDRHPKGLNPL